MSRSKYRKTLSDYLLWRQEGNIFLRPAFDFDPVGITAEQAIKRWESEGKPLPASTSEPDLLADYVQGKLSRDWHISEWRNGIKEGLFEVEEFIGSLGCTKDNYQKLLAAGGKK